MRPCFSVGSRSLTSVGEAFSTCIPRTGRTHDHVSPELGPEELAQCLRHVLGYDPGKRLWVIHDRGAPHQGTGIAAVAREATGRLILKPQPAYSPALNPQERLWQWWRRVVTHHHRCATLREPTDAIRHFCRYLAGVKDQAR